MATKRTKRTTSPKRKRAAKPATAKPPVAPEAPADSTGTRETEPPPPPTEPPKACDGEPTEQPPWQIPVSTFVAERDVVVEAVYLEARERGLSDREARSFAEDVADRLRLDDEQRSGPPDTAYDTRDESCVGDVPFYDLRTEQDFVYPGGKNKVRKRGRSVVMRNPADIDTIVIHQTAVEFGVSRRAIANAGGDVELARARRALDVACHAMAFRQGYFVAAHPLLAYVNHANRFNATSLGMEIDGRYPGLTDDPSTVPREDLLTTWGGEPTELTNTTMGAAFAALRWLVEEGRALGCPITKIVSHRQSSDNRRSDPGEEIWRRLVLASASKLGLVVVRESPWNQGRHVPTAWDDKGIGAY